MAPTPPDSAASSAAASAPGAGRQVFQTSSPRRWRLVVWSSRLLLLALLGAAGVLAWSLSERSATLLPAGLQRHALLHRALEGQLVPEWAHHPNQAVAKARQSLATAPRPYRDRRSRPAAAKTRGPAETGAAPAPALAADTARPVPLRAGFYVNWDAQSLYSLRRYGQKLNLVLPEWLFLNDSLGGLTVQPDTAALRLLRQRHAAVVPMISNYHHERWDGAAVRRLVASAPARQKFIGRVLAVLRRYRFQGVNVDFESAELEDPGQLVAFQRELHAALKQHGYLVTQDIAPGNDDYSPAELARANDYVFVMAYDLHAAETAAGPVAALPWVEGQLRRLVREVPPRQLVLGVAGYGYDWPLQKGAPGADVTYQEAVTTARESQAVPQFSPATGELSYRYYDDNDQEHQVNFTDAASAFNALRLAHDCGLGGVALWRLGSEDPRLWTFYDRDLSRAGLRRRPFDLHNLAQTAPTPDIDYIGEGEVLDLRSTPAPGQLALAYDSTGARIGRETYVKLPAAYVVRKLGIRPKTVVLTFDDGPDPKYTPEVLDILEREHVPAAFFVVGENAESNLPLLKRLYDSGYEIGNHTFTHPNLAAVSPARAKLELNATRRLIECVTGHSTLLFRPPYNADAEPQTLEELLPVATARQDNYLTVGESIDPQDWRPGVTPQQIVAQIKAEEDQGSMILLHDAGGDRSATVAALPEIIHYFKQKGYHFGTVAELMGRRRADLMPALTNRREQVLARADWWTAQALYAVLHGVVTLFLVGIVLTVLRQLLLAGLALRQRRRRPVPAVPAPPPGLAGAANQGEWPGVSLIVPAYNEEVNAVASLRNLLAGDYPADRFEVVFVDDGSRDATYERVRTAFADEPRVRVLRKANGGKASALNVGIAQARHELLVCIDADTQLAPDAVRRLVARFTAPDVVAVAGNVKVGNERNLLTRWQAIEYLTSQNFDRRAFELLNCITVVPGAIGAFRKADLLAAGGFTTDTLAEDCDLTVRLLRQGGRVAYAPDAVAVTEAPETTAMLLKQRLRWTFGTFQTFWKHRDLAFNLRAGWLGWVPFLNVLIFQLVLPLFNPVADVLMLFALLSGQGAHLLGYYALFLAVDAGAAALAFRFERERLGRLWALVPQRFAYRWLLYVVLVRALRRALRGELVGWGHLKRTGHAQLAATSSAQPAEVAALAGA